MPPRLQRSLRARITLALLAVTVALAVVAGSAMVALTRLGGAVDTILRENYRSVVACDQMNESLERIDSAALLAATGRGDLAGPMLAQHRARFEHALAAEWRNLTLPAEGEAVRALEASWRAYTASLDGGDGRDTEGYVRALLPRFQSVKSSVARVRRMNQSAMESADRSARALARRSTLTTLALVVLALALALRVAWQVPRALVRPLGSLADAARAVGDGALDVSLDAPDLEELAPVVEAFRKMVAQLRAYRDSSLGALRAAQALADATVRGLADPVVVCDDAGAVQLANDAAAQAFGVEAGGAADALPEGFVRARDEVLSTGRAVTTANLADAMRWRDRGGERSFLVRATALRDGEGHARGAVIVAQDVTRLRRIDDLKSDMVATVSHEFKTPLTSLRMATHLLLEPAAGPLTDAQREIVTTARDDTERLRALVDELLDLVRIETEAGALRRVPIEPARLLHVAREAHLSVARNREVSLAVEADTSLAPFEVDVEKLGIVLANLLSNAIRHTPAGGTVTLRATGDAHAVTLSVADTGDGVALDTLTRLLEGSAARPREAPVGGWRHGLGLTIAREIVLQHGGELTAESAPGAGSTFTVVIPRDVKA